MHYTKRWLENTYDRPEEYVATFGFRDGYLLFKKEQLSQLLKFAYLRMGDKNIDTVQLKDRERAWKTVWSKEKSQLSLKDWIKNEILS